VHLHNAEIELMSHDSRVPVKNQLAMPLQLPSQPLQPPEQVSLQLPWQPIWHPPVHPPRQVFSHPPLQPWHAPEQSTQPAEGGWFRASSGAGALPGLPDACRARRASSNSAWLRVNVLASVWWPAAVSSRAAPPISNA
jgi:hypothetical protein